MPGYLKYIEIENFKSYRGRHRIGPLARFTAVIGPNGSGKSNLMDAVCFAVGEKTSALRVKRLQDLIHGAPVGKPVANRASVTLVYAERDDTIKVTGPYSKHIPAENDEAETRMVRFTRLVHGAQSEYRIDDEPVRSEDYARELERIGVNIKSKNFMVFQGTVESIALKNARERTAMFEEISRSGEMREQYESALRELTHAEESVHDTLQRKKGIDREKKEAKMERDEADRYRALMRSYKDKQIEMHLFRLFFNEKECEALSRQVTSQTSSLEREREECESAEVSAREKRKEQAKAVRELNRAEERMRDVDAELLRKRPEYIKAKERTRHLNERLKEEQRQLATAQEAHRSHRDEMDALRKQLDTLEASRLEFEANVQAEATAQGRSLELEASQLRTYNELKEMASRRAAGLIQEVESAERTYRSETDRADQLGRVRSDLEAQISRKQQELADNERRVQKLVEYVAQSKKSLAEMEASETTLQTEIDTLRRREEELLRELAEVQQQLGDAKVEKYETERQVKRTELVETLKRLYPGVYGRLMELCELSHKRYAVAITRVMGASWMDAIVVDSEKTARDCIQFMKEQRLEAERFLPLDSLRVTPVREQLRAARVRDRPNVKLVYDVLHCEVPAVKKALQFVCGNALVCETVEDARHVAFSISSDDGEERSERQKTVSLDGVMFEKTGIISGGGAELRSRARRWDAKSLASLKSRREQLLLESRELARTKHKENELLAVRSQKSGLQTRLKYSQQDLENTKHAVEANRRELTRLEQRAAELEPEARSADTRVQRLADQVAQKRTELNASDDEVFGEFCAEIGVSNIRVFEEREVRFHQDRVRRRLEFDNQRKRLQNQLEYERTRNTEANVDACKRNIERDEPELQRLVTAENAAKQVIDELDAKKRSLDEARGEARKKVADIEAEFVELRKAQQTQERELAKAQKQLQAMSARLEILRNDRHSILKECKMNDIKIPLSSGSLDDIVVTAAQSSSGADGESGSASNAAASAQDARAAAQAERETHIKVDYRGLPHDLRAIEPGVTAQTKQDELAKALAEQYTALQRVSASSLKTSDKLDDVRERLHETAGEFERAKQSARRAKQRFEDAKRQRIDRFAACFELVATKMDELYKSLCSNASAQAFLTAENSEEPYLEGVQCNCVVPGKRFRPMDNLSGGEKTVAALALLFAVHAYQPAPFFVLDEIDAALDNTNVGNVARFIRMQAHAASGAQFIVISLKEEFFNQADALVGIYPAPMRADTDCLVSQFLSLDLAAFQDDAEDSDDGDAADDDAAPANLSQQPGTAAAAERSVPHSSVLN